MFYLEAALDYYGKTYSIEKGKKERQKERQAERATVIVRCFGDVT